MLVGTRGGGAAPVPADSPLAFLPLAAVKPEVGHHINLTRWLGKLSYFASQNELLNRRARFVADAGVARVNPSAALKCAGNPPWLNKSASEFLIQKT